MNAIKKISQILFIIGLPVLLFTISVSAAANSAWLYEWGFTKYNVGHELGIDTPDLHRVADGLINYWNNGEKTFNITVTKDGQPYVLFNDNEVHHLSDIKNLFHLLYKCLLGSFIYVLAFVLLTRYLWKDRFLLGVGLMWGSGVSILLMIMLGLLAITDFHWLFWEFHVFSFANRLWLMDPRVDFLVVLFPDGFWFDMAMICSAFKIFMALILGFAGWQMLKEKPERLRLNS